MRNYFWIGLAVLLFEKNQRSICLTRLIMELLVLKFWCVVTYIFFLFSFVYCCFVASFGDSSHLCFLHWPLMATWWWFEGNAKSFTFHWTLIVMATWWKCSFYFSDFQWWNDGTFFLWVMFCKWMAYVLCYQWLSRTWSHELLCTNFLQVNPSNKHISKLNFYVWSFHKLIFQAITYQSSIASQTTHNNKVFIVWWLFLFYSMKFLFDFLYGNI